MPQTREMLNMSVIETSHVKVFPGFYMVFFFKKMTQTREMLNMSVIEKMKVQHFPGNVKHVKHVRLSGRT